MKKDITGKGIIRRATAIVLSFIMAAAMVPEMAFAEELIVTEDNVTEEDIVDKTESTTTYELTGGEKMTVFHSEDVRYEDEDCSAVNKVDTIF